MGEFANNELSVEIKQNVRDKDVYVLQSGCGSDGTSGSFDLSPR